MYVNKSQFHTPVSSESQYPSQHWYDGAPAKGVRDPWRISAVTCTSCVGVLSVLVERGGMARVDISCGVEQ